MKKYTWEVWADGWNRADSRFRSRIRAVSPLLWCDPWGTAFGCCSGYGRRLKLLLLLRLLPPRKALVPREAEK